MNIEVTNFQSIATASLHDVSGLTVIIGPSNRGKSALFRAIEAALFNRPGDDFVRVGTKAASVSLTGVPSAAGPALAVAYTKGKVAGAAFVINGESFAKLGGKTPPPLLDAGYRDAWVGDRERNRGDAIRPQVATQFEPMFLLQRGGNFIADALGLFSRQQVVSAAHGRCQSDLRSTKQLRGVRQADLDKASVALEAFAALAPRRAAVEAVVTMVSALRRHAVEVSTLSALRARRRAPLRLATTTLPPQGEAVVVDAGVRNALRGLAAARRQLRTRVGIEIPDTVLPELPSYPTQLATLVATRQRLVGVQQALPTEAVPLAVLHKWDAAVAVRDQMSARVRRQRKLLDAQFALQAARRNAEAELVDAETALAAFLAAHPMCPTCGRPQAVVE